MPPVQEGASSRDRRIASIDALRGVAVLAVFCVHYFEIAQGITRTHDDIVAALHSIDLGRCGVVLFFAISGFVIPSTMRRDGGKGLRTFLVNRFFRLFPAFWLSIPISAAARWWNQKIVFTVQDIVLNMTMIPNALGSVPANGAYWTLGIELTFYSLCALIFIGRGERLPFLYAMLGCFGFVVFMSSQPSIFGNLINEGRLSADTFTMCLYLGIMLWATVIRMWWSGAEVDILSKAACVGFAAFWILWEPAKLIHAYATDNFFDVDQRLICGYSIPLAVFVCGLLLIRIEWHWLTWIGRISYSFYLCHGPVAMLVVSTCMWAQWTHAGVYWFAVVVSASLTLLVSQAMFTFVEAPSIRLGYRLVGQRVPPSSVAEASHASRPRDALIPVGTPKVRDEAV